MTVGSTYVTSGEPVEGGHLQPVLTTIRLWRTIMAFAALPLRALAAQEGQVFQITFGELRDIRATLRFDAIGLDHLLLSGLVVRSK
ncbi:hypothetical protein PP1Y_AT16787 [Novosphingobium sp. PP1Y]|nr:hypothetical protein PP1Y_AT16787 [Novosphingobium sp. PP1Y]